MSDGQEDGDSDSLSSSSYDSFLALLSDEADEDRIHEGEEDSGNHPGVTNSVVDHAPTEFRTENEHGS